MESLVVECLRCGNTRGTSSAQWRAGHSECPRCGYLGWAAITALTEDERRSLRSRPPERRRLRVV